MAERTSLRSLMESENEMLPRKSLSQLNPQMDWRRPSLRNPPTVIPEDLKPKATPSNFNEKRKSIVPVINNPLLKFEDLLEDESEEEEEVPSESPGSSLGHRIDHDKHIANISRMHHEAHHTLQHMFRAARGDDCILLHFIAWIAIDEQHFQDFFCRFRPDGTMTWKEFEWYVHWHRHWQGETLEVFGLLEEDHCGFITNGAVLKLKRWYQKRKHLGEADLRAFRRRFSDHYGNLGRAWRLALDPYNTHKCGFYQFCRVCHSLGVKSHLRTIWDLLTEGDVNRPMYYRDLDPDGDMVLQSFVTSLALHGGTVMDGWQQMILDGGGHVHRAAFIVQCEHWGISIGPAKWLFAVLDPNSTRYLTEFDDMEFLAKYDPGPLEAGAVTFKAKVTGDGSANRPFKSCSGIATTSTKGQSFDLVVELTREEFQTYRDKLKSRMMIAGVGPEEISASLAAPLTPGVEPAARGGSPTRPSLGSSRGGGQPRESNSSSPSRRGL